MKSLLLVLAMGGVAAAEPAPDFVTGNAPKTAVKDPASPGRTLIEPTDMIMFDTDSAALRDAAMDQVDHVAAWLNTHPGYSLAIEGYADISGTAAYNNELAFSRAGAVKARLGAQGVADNRMVIVGYGEEAASKSLNSNDRRVVMYATQLTGQEIAARSVRRGALRATWFARGAAFDMLPSR